jgi:hypothetical protein
MREIKLEVKMRSILVSTGKRPSQLGAVWVQYIPANRQIIHIENLLLNLPSVPGSVPQLRHL